MGEKETSSQDRLKNAESALQTLQNEEVDAVVGRKGLSMLSLQEIEEKLRLSEVRYRGIVESQREMICRCTPDRVLTFVNDAYCSFFGRSRRQLVGAKGLREIVAKDALRVEAALAGLSRERPYADLEYRVRAGNEIRWTYWTHQAIFDPEGRLHEIQSIGRDISHHKRIEDELREAKEYLEQRVRERTAELEAKHRELEAMNLQIRHLTRKTQETMENERRTIAKELHDSIGAGLSAVKFSLEQRLSEMDELPDAGRLSFEQILSYLNDTIKETKRISRGLRPSTLDDLGLLPTIEIHTEKLCKVYLGINFVQEIGIEEVDVPERVKIEVYRVLQEALNNACRHSGADTIHIAMNKKENHLILDVRDNGHGFEVKASPHDIGESGGYGLQSMRDRVEINGGIFQIESSPNEGTWVRVLFPCNLPHSHRR